MLMNGKPSLGSRSRNGAAELLGFSKQLSLGCPYAATIKHITESSSSELKDLKLTKKRDAQFKAMRSHREAMGLPRNALCRFISSTEEFFQGVGITLGRSDVPGLRAAKQVLGCTESVPY
jgi:hypothetical protein